MNWIAISLMSLSFLAILISAEVLYRLTQLPTEWTRKIQHIVSGGVAATFPWIFSSPYEVLILGAIMTLALAALRKSRWLTSLHGVKRETLGEFYFLASAVILSFLCKDRAPLFYFIPFLTLTFSDSLAALVGMAYKKMSYSIKGHVKSLEGSIAFFVSAFLTAHLSLLLLSEIQPLQSILIALEIALITTVAEAVGRKGIDNLLIPLSAFYLLLHLTNASLLVLICELSGLAVGSIFFFTYLIRKERIQLPQRLK